MINTKSLTISNFLSLLRVMLIVPIFQGLMQNTPEGNAWALFYMGLAITTDFLDGFLARRLDQVTDLGKVLDPLADKICILGVGLTLALPFRDNPLPLWFLIVILGKDIAIVTGAFMIYRRRKIVPTSNIWGKSTSTIIAAMLVSYVLQLDFQSPWLLWLNYKFLLWLSLSFILVSMVSYSWRFFVLMGAPRRSTVPES